MTYSWKSIRKDGTNPEDRPRFLSRKEIEEIADVLPLIPGANRESSNRVRDFIKADLIIQLTKIEICPSQIESLKEELIFQHYNSLITPGTAVGEQAACALGAINTQNTLSTFHKAGSLDTVTDQNRVTKENINAKKERMNEIYTIHYKNKHLTMRQVLASRMKLEGTTFSNLLETHSIMRVDRMKKEEWRDIWPEAKSSLCLVCKMKSSELYRQGLSLSTIATMLESDRYQIIFSSRSMATIEFYPRTDKIGELRKTLRDIGVNPDKVENLTPATVERAFLDMYLLDILNKRNLKGIVDITHLSPQRKEVLTFFVKNQEKLEEDEWKWIFDKDKSHKYGISFKHLEKICDTYGFQYENRGEDFIVKSDIDPRKSIIERFRAEKKRLDEWLSENLREIVPPESSLITCMEYSYSVVLGNTIVKGEGRNKLRDLLVHPLVDSNRTTSNNMHHMCSTLGVESAYNTFLSEMEQGSIHPSNLKCIAEIIMSKGEPHGASFVGVSRSVTGATTLAGFQKSFKAFQDAVIAKKNEGTNNTTAAVASGVRFKLGTGSIHVGYRKDGKIFLDQQVYIPSAPEKMNDWMAASSEEDETESEEDIVEHGGDEAVEEIESLTDLLGRVRVENVVGPVASSNDNPYVQERKGGVLPRKVATNQTIQSDALVNPIFSTSVLERNLFTKENGKMKPSKKVIAPISVEEDIGQPEVEEGSRRKRKVKAINLNEFFDE